MSFPLDEDPAGGPAPARRPGRGGVVRNLSEVRARRREPVVRADVLAGLMRDGYGDDPRIDDLASRLAGLSPEEALDLSLASDLDELDAMLPGRDEPPAGDALPA